MFSSEKLKPSPPVVSAVKPESAAAVVQSVSLMRVRESMMNSRAGVSSQPGMMILLGLIGGVCAGVARADEEMVVFERGGARMSVLSRWFCRRWKILA